MFIFFFSSTLGKIAIVLIPRSSIIFNSLMSSLMLNLFNPKQLLARRNVFKIKYFLTNLCKLTLDCQRLEYLLPACEVDSSTLMIIYLLLVWFQPKPSAPLTTLLCHFHRLYLQQQVSIAPQEGESHHVPDW